MDGGLVSNKNMIVIMQHKTPEIIKQTDQLDTESTIMSSHTQSDESNIGKKKRRKLDNANGALQL